MKTKYVYLLVLLLVFMPSFAQETVRIGIIGLDTSHSPAFIKLLNGDDAPEEYKGYKITAAYPYGSRTIESSLKRIPGYTEEAKNYGVEIVGSITELLEKTDCILLETNDGNLHLEQAIEVMKTGKPMFIDKPVAAKLADALAIYMLADKYNTPVFSSSALRFVPRNQELRNGVHGKVIGADCYSPATSEPSHPDFSWYGIHGVETLYTIMGVGCKEVTRTSTEGTDVVTGLWNDGRIGTFRGLRDGKTDFGGTAFCEKTIVPAGGYEGYTALLGEIIRFFKTKKVPVTKEETIEIFVFMEASNESKRRNGAPVSMKSILDKETKEAEKILRNKKL